MLDRIKEEKIIPVVKIENLADAVPTMRALKAGGIGIAEITFRTACGREALALAARECKDMLIGAGTIINVQQAVEAINSGARFLVSPGFGVDIAKCCKEKGVPYIGGCVTSTEIMMALENGFSTVKFFPAENYGGVATMKALSAAFPSVTFVPTGGINAENISRYLAFDKVVACGGSWMVSPSLIAKKDFAEITRLSREAKEIVSACGRKQ